VGTLVTVPFGKRSIKGVVVDQKEVRDLKSSIKSSNYALRNVTTVHTETLPSSIFTAAQNTARYFSQSIGPILKTVIPDQIFDYYLTYPVDEQKTSIRSDIQLIQIPYRERIAYYRTLIRENLGRHVSTMIVTPTVIQAEKIFESMKTGIEDMIVIAHSKKTKKHIEKVITQALNPKKPVVLITTAPFATLVRSDWDTLIIESSSSSSYRYEFNPIFDLSYFVEEIGKSYHSRIIYADTLITANLRSRASTRELIDTRSTWHIAKPERFEVIDNKVKPFLLFNKKTKSLIEEALTSKSNTLLLTTRKGLAPITTCSDCGTLVTCPICTTPLVLHRKKDSTKEHPEHIYLCHHCMHTTKPIDSCISCGSWRLTALGVSTDSIIQELDTLFPEAKVFTVDGDVTTTMSQVQKTVTTWQEKPGSILVATPLVLPYIDRADFGSIISMDSLLSLPTYTSGEHALHTAMLFLEKIDTAAVLQTRNFKNETIQAIYSENIFDFMKNEQDVRSQLGYPPKKILLKISREVSKDSAKEAVTYLEKILDPYNPDLLMKKSRKVNTVIVQAIMKVEPTIWNDANHDIHQVMEILGRDWKKEINPESVL
jgi:primosomal protein N'